MEPPIACTLEAAELPDRLEQWRLVLHRARARTTADDGALRVELGDDVDIVDLAQLVAAEQSCCAYFSFAITLDSRGLGLEVGAPAGAEPVVASLFGTPAG